MNVNHLHSLWGLTTLVIRTSVFIPVALHYHQVTIVVTTTSIVLWPAPLSQTTIAPLAPQDTSISDVAINKLVIWTICVAHNQRPTVTLSEIPHELVQILSQFIIEKHRKKSQTIYTRDLMFLFTKPVFFAFGYSVLDMVLLGVVSLPNSTICCTSKMSPLTHTTTCLLLCKPTNDLWGYSYGFCPWGYLLQYHMMYLCVVACRGAGRHLCGLYALRYKHTSLLIREC